MLLCTLMLTCSFVGCGSVPPVADRDYNEAEVIEAAKELLPRSMLINELFYGSGIPASDAEGAREHCPRKKK